MNGLPWDNAEQYGKHSPIYFAAAFRTPTLVIENGDDPQAEELYFALRSRRLESALLRFPQPLQAAGRVACLEAELAWFARFPGSNQPAPH